MEYFQFSHPTQSLFCSELGIANRNVHPYQRQKRYQWFATDPCFYEVSTSFVNARCTNYNIFAAVAGLVLMSLPCTPILTISFGKKSNALELCRFSACLIRLTENVYTNGQRLIPAFLRIPCGSAHWMFGFKDICQESVLHTSWPHQVSYCTVGFLAGQHTLPDSSFCNKVKEEDFHRRLAFLGRQPLWGMGVTSVMETTRSPPVSRPLRED